MRCFVKKCSFYFLQTYCLIILLGAFSSSCYKIQWMIIPQSPSPAHSWFYNLSNHSQFLLFLRKVLVYVKYSHMESIPYLSSSLSQLSIPLQVLLYLFGEGDGKEYFTWDRRPVFAMDFYNGTRFLILSLLAFYFPQIADDHWTGDSREITMIQRTLSSLKAVYLKSNMTY